MTQVARSPFYNSPFMAPAAKRRRLAAPFSAPKRASMMARRRSSGPPGTTRRFVSKVVRDMPLYAPPLASRNEMKYIDIELAAYAADTTGVVTFVTPIIPGSLLVGQREGSRVMLCGTQLRGVAVAGTTGALSQACALLVYDRQSNGAAPAILDVLEQVSSYSYQNTVNRSRFDILGRWNFTLIGNSTTPTVGQELKQIDIKTTFRKPQVWNQAATGAQADIVSGGLYLLTFGDTAAGTAAGVINVHIRTFYGDN